MNTSGFYPEGQPLEWVEEEMVGVLFSELQALNSDCACDCLRSSLQGHTGAKPRST